QAEDGIRDYKVTGVQTCALPILGSFGDDTAEEAEDLVLTDFGLDRQFAAFDKVDQPKLILRELEEVVLFGDGLGGLAVGADGAEIGRASCRERVWGRGEEVRSTI